MRDIFITSRITAGVSVLEDEEEFWKWVRAVVDVSVLNATALYT